MNTKAQDEAPYIGQDILRVIKTLNGSRVEVKGHLTVLYEPDYRELFYDNDHCLVVVAVDCDTLPPDMTVEFFNRSKGRAVLRGILGQHVEALEADRTLYFRVEVPSVGEVRGRRNGHLANSQSRRQTSST